MARDIFHDLVRAGLEAEGGGSAILEYELTQDFLRPSPLAPLPLRERGIRQLFYYPSPVLGEGVGG